jgi:hypothetical protein
LEDNEMPGRLYTNSQGEFAFKLELINLWEEPATLLEGLILKYKY